MQTVPSGSGVSSLMKGAQGQQCYYGWKNQPTVIRLIPKIHVPNILQESKTNHLFCGVYLFSYLTPVFPSNSSLLWVADINIAGNNMTMLLKPSAEIQPSSSRKGPINAGIFIAVKSSSGLSLWKKLQWASR